MESRSVLLVASDRDVRDRLLRAMGEVGAETPMETAAGAFEAVKRVASHPYRAVICVVDSADEISYVIRLKKANNELPVVMLTSVRDPAFRSLGEQMGADHVLRARADAKRNAEGLLRVLETRELARRTRPYIVRAQELVHEVRRLNRANRELIASALGMAAACERGEFSVLIVEDAESDLRLMTHALEKAGLPPMWQTVTSVAQATRFLRGEGPFRDRAKHPVPSLIISDLHLQDAKGLDLLRFVREAPDLRHIGFILHTSSEQEEDRLEATRWGANFYVLKSPRTDSLVEIVHGVFTRFIQERMGFSP